jgi:small subunit ribosomal protein S16
LSVSIRLTRTGKKKQPYYRIVAIDKRRARDGKFLEILGHYNPITQPAKITVHEDQLTQWLNEGAQPSDTVSSLLTQIGFLEKYEKAKRGEDVSGIEVKTTLTERKKKTRRVKKAALAAAEAAKAEAEASAKAEAGEPVKAKEAEAAEGEAEDKADEKAE